MQRFKGDELEIKFDESGRALFTDRSNQKTLFFNQSYGCFELGRAIVDSNLSPLARAIPREVFAESFGEVFDAFAIGGTFEAYLSVFKKIFNEDVVVVFDVIAPGVLDIDISASGTEISNFSVRKVQNNEFQIFDLIDQDENEIMVQVFEQFVSEYELNLVLRELVPAGVFVDITLTITGG